MTKWAKGERFPDPLFGNRRGMKTLDTSHMDSSSRPPYTHKHAHVGALVSDNNYRVHSFRA